MYINEFIHTSNYSLNRDKVNKLFPNQLQFKRIMWTDIICQSTHLFTDVKLSTIQHFI